MRVAIVHNAVPEDAPPDVRDVLEQAEVVRGALVALGHQPESLPCTLDLAALRGALEALAPDVVFNLVEGLDGHGRLIHLVPSLLEALRLPCTGSSADGMYVSSHKLLGKERLRAGGLETPPLVGVHPAVSWSGLVAGQPGTRAIVKSVWEHASVALDEGGIVPADDLVALARVMAARAPLMGGECFAEGFVDGREFNLSLLAGPDGPEVLPPAEIRFDGFEEGRARIVDYRAKWDEGSFEYQNTERTFDLGPGDGALVARLRDAALRCWGLFGLGGYARVDFRVDEAGRPFILEVNANPCLSPGAGFAAAVARAGLDFEEAVGRILADALPA